MSICYIDSSVVVAIIAGEPQARRFASKIRSATALLSHHLIEAEIGAFAVRESLPLEEAFAALGGVELLFPDSSLRTQLLSVFRASHIRGADALHLACALWVGGAVLQSLAFLTLDVKQAALAEALGLRVP